MLAPIDWTRPWYDAVRPTFERMAADGLAGASACLAGRSNELCADGARGLIDAFNRVAAANALRTRAGLALRFVPQAALPEGQAYEDFIATTGQVPTRANLHDFFNALVWLAYPRIKQELNALQAAQIARDGVGKSRGAARDGATIFDENAALLVLRDAPDCHALLAALRAHDWTDALLTRRAAFGPRAQLWLFGHALMEKLVAPRKAITAHTRALFAPDDFFDWPHDARRAWIDAELAGQLAREGLSTACFTPLPVLGVPHWWPGQDQAFYRDATVFRPRRPSITGANA